MLEESRLELVGALEAWPGNLEFNRDLQPFFIGGDMDMRDRFLAGLRAAGFDR